ncbi:MAG: hypothetical protein COX02_02450 [Candidatus Vogelbacteria bacterium CG22_combo_CG10-13_8_21_14_all_37_9]|uniref:LTD domain-containing protein n=1 Tax=Candidatus Vogelbacteria bacterium CG22_combo_CG10-13_8_21_14_all_37_9 TaxID=1975046 RepID=A0A2H0BK43_9BACT|nr:MAG: hypothetical protein COX02_02450 [Candidatus Vogelbacteria bacterium CG22_combo_CG10-13_8_21_14_all_37_9]
MKDDLIWIVVVLLILFGLWFTTGGPSRSDNQKPFITPPTSAGDSQSYGSLSPNSKKTSIGSSGNTNSEIIKDPNASSYQGLIHLSRGNANSETNANDEYIEIRADRQNKNPINISTWTLRNGGDNRSYDQNGQMVKGQSNTARLPGAAVNIWTSLSAKKIVSIKLSANERAYIISGSPFSYGNPYNIRESFRVNKCMGYIENLPNYRFVPRLSSKCPAPRNDPTLAQLPEQCYNQLRSLGTCQTIDFVTKDAWCRLHYNDQALRDKLCNLPSYCKNIIKDQYTYEACVRNHQTDDDFFQPEWRLYLGSIWEIWASRNETISLYDEKGKLVDEIKY